VTYSPDNFFNGEFTQVEPKRKDDFHQENYFFQNYPNPFNPNTTIRFDLPRTSHVVLTIYNVIGQNVRTLVEGIKRLGAHTVQWDGKDDSGQDLPSGIYLCKFKTEELIQAKKMFLLR
jgi:hypothetical protein